MQNKIPVYLALRPSIAKAIRRLASENNLTRSEYISDLVEAELDLVYQKQTKETKCP